MADVVAEQGLVQVMRELVAEPDGDERSWLGTAPGGVPQAADGPGVPGAVAGALGRAGRRPPSPGWTARPRWERCATTCRCRSWPATWTWCWRGWCRTWRRACPSTSSTARCSTWSRAACAARPAPDGTGGGYSRGRARAPEGPAAPPPPPGPPSTPTSPSTARPAVARRLGGQKSPAQHARAPAGPRHEHPVPGPEQRGDVDQVRAREHTHGGRTDRLREVARARVVADEQVRTLQHADHRREREPPGQVDAAVGGRAQPPPRICAHQPRVAGAAQHHHPRPPRVQLAAPSSPSRSGGHRRRGLGRAGVHGADQRAGASRPSSCGRPRRPGPRPVTATRGRRCYRLPAPTSERRPPASAAGRAGTRPRHRPVQRGRPRAPGSPP